MTEDEKTEAWDAGYKSGVRAGRHAMQDELDRRNQVARRWDIDATWGGRGIGEELRENHLIVCETEPLKGNWRIVVPCCLRGAKLPELDEQAEVGVTCCRCGIVYTAQAVPRYAAGFEDWEGHPLITLLVDRTSAVAVIHRERIQA